MTLPSASSEELVELLADVLERQPQATLIVDAGGRIVAFDPRVGRIFARFAGRPPVIGEVLADALPAAEAERARAALRAAGAGESVRLDYGEIDDGNRLTYDVRVSPLQRGGACITFSSVDARRVEAEAALRQREAQLSAAMEAGRIVPWEWSIDEDRVTRALELPILGPDPKSLATFLAHVHPDDRHLVQEALDATLNRGAPYAITYRKVAEGQTRWLDARAALVRNEQGRALKLVGVVVDITDRRRLEDQLLQAQKMDAIGRLAGGVAHDFNNILTAIMTSTHLLERRLGECLETREVLEASQRAAGLTQQLLAFGRRQILRPTVLDLGAIVSGTTGLLGRILGEDIDVRTEIAPDLWRIRGDGSQLEQVVLNLTVNARDAMPSGGTLSIALTNETLSECFATGLGLRAGEHVRLRVRDCGVGMDEETRARIFEPFFTTKRSGMGTGLGLATVYGVVAQLGGSIAVESAPGRGSTFDVYLPATDEQARPSGHALGDTHTKGSETILLVEDEPGVRRSTRVLLEVAGYRVLEADDGDTAIELARTHSGPIHLVISDVVMRRVGGVAAAQGIRELRAGAKVIFMTGYSEDAVVRQGLVSGDITVIRKPFAPDAFFRTVRRALDA
ncbi:MAG: response regulator [Deltaproteobacteria bacterium]|nr:response regulator [Deltaproteobacteria bacterium]